MAHIEATRREQQQPPIGTPPPGRQERRGPSEITGRSVTYRHRGGDTQEPQQPSSTDGQQAAAKLPAVTLSIVEVDQQNGVPQAEDGTRRSYTAAVKDGRKQTATYTSKNM